MKKIISFISILCIMLTLTSCNLFLTTKAAMTAPDGKTIIEVEAEDFGNNAYFTTRKELSNLSVNRMLYDHIKDEYTLEETVYEKETLKPEECLKIIMDFEQIVPYVMVKYTVGEKTYEQYVYYNNNKEKLMLLERE